MNQDHRRETKDVLPVLVMGGLFILIHSLALVMVGPFEAADMVAFENPDDPMNIVQFFLTLLLFTGAILLLLSTAATSVLVITLIKYPEWYVIDICGITIAVYAIAILGISLSVFLVIVLLIGLAIYDAISVYKTKHMIDLADTFLDLKLPVVVVIPKTRSYSLIRETKSLKEKLESEEERDAFFMGLGDFVMPGILVASTFHNIASNGLLIALSVMIGTLLGFAALIKAVATGKPQAGLPYLCSGAIAGYLVSSYILLGGLAGLALPV
jgi:presenilin-like A22 family membrane protease